MPTARPWVGSRGTATAPGPAGRVGHDHLDPGVAAALAQEVAGHVAGGQAAQPAQAEHHVGVVLAHALGHAEGAGGGGVDVGRPRPVAHQPVDPGVDVAGQVGAPLPARQEAVGGVLQGVVGPGERRRMQETGVVQAVGPQAGGAVGRRPLGHCPRLELDQLLHPGHADLDLVVAELVHLLLDPAGGAADFDPVLDPDLVAVAGGGHGHEPVAEVVDGPVVDVGHPLPDDEPAGHDPRPVDLVGVEQVVVLADGHRHAGDSARWRAGATGWGVTIV